MKELLDTLRSDWLELKDEFEMAVLRKWSEDSRKNLIMYAGKISLTAVKFPEFQLAMLPAVFYSETTVPQILKYFSANRSCLWIHVPIHAGPTGAANAEAHSQKFIRNKSQSNNGKATHVSRRVFHGYQQILLPTGHPLVFWYDDLYHSCRRHRLNVHDIRSTGLCNI
nr:odorant receptor 17 [Psyttalia incisi]